jgi:ATP-dependent helicase/nuclease subunit B
MPSFACPADVTPAVSDFLIEAGTRKRVSGPEHDSMTTRVLTGTFEVLEARFLEMIEEKQAGDSLAPVAVLVGSNILSAYLKSRMAARGHSVANVRYYTFLDLVAKLCAGAGDVRRKRRLPHLGASLLLADLLEEQSPEVFARVAGYAGFRAVLLDTFRDLRDAGITPDLLEGEIPALQGLTPDRAKHILGLAELYRRFRTRLTSFQDVADDFRRAGAAAAAAERMLGTASLLVYGIYDVTGMQAALLRSLHETMELSCFIPYVNEAASRFARPFLEARTRDSGTPPVSISQHSRTDGLGLLTRRVFPPPEDAPSSAASSPIGDDGSFALVSAPGASRAAVEIVRELLRAARDGVIKGFYEAAVLLRHPEEELPILTETFRLRRIPYYAHGGGAFGRRPLARAVLAVAGLEAESFSRRSVLTAMEMIAAALPADAAETWDVPRWRALVNTPRFLAGPEAWDRGTEALVRELQLELKRVEEVSTAEEENGEEAENGVRASVHRLRQRLAAARSLRSGWAALRRATADWPESDTWPGWAALLQDRLESLLEKSEDWPAFSNVFDDLASLGELPMAGDRGSRVSRARIVPILAEAVDTLGCPEGRFQRSGVNLLSAAAARGLRFPLVIIPGLEEGRFPARLRQDPMLLDAERRQLGRPPLLPLKSLRLDEEELLFAMAVRSAERRLVLVTSRLDEASDREKIPSQFFLRCAAAARGAALTLNELNPEIVPALRSVSLDDPGPGKGQIAVDRGEVRLGLLTEDPAHARAALPEMAEVEPSLIKGPLACDQARWLQRLTPYDGHIQDPALWPMVARMLGTGNSQLSASRVEEYAKCPYLFYLRRVQELEKWEEEEQVEGLDPLVRGQVMHSILESFMKEFAGERFVRTALTELAAALSAHARRMLEECRPAALPDLLWEIERDRLLATLDEWLRFEREDRVSPWRTLYLERAFGTFGGVTESPPYQVQGEGASIEFRGRVDRIDVSPDGRHARVIDYKTGTLPVSMKSGKRTLLMGGEKIQLAVYCGALAGMPELASVESVEGEYLHLQTRDATVEACSYSMQELGTAMQRLPEMLTVISEGIGRGVFPARASGRVFPYGHCEYCDFLVICGKDRRRRQESKESDPEVRKLRRLQELDGLEEEE